MKISELKPGNLFSQIEARGEIVEYLMIAPDWVIQIDQPLTPRHIETVGFGWEPCELLDANAGALLPWAADYLDNLRFCCMGYEMKSDAERAAYWHYSSLVGAGYALLPYALQMKLYGYR